MTKKNTSKSTKTKIFTTKQTNTTKQGFMPKSLHFNSCKHFSSTHFTYKNTHTKAFFRKSNHHTQQHTKITSTKTTKTIDNRIHE